jgi:hypothetical protein
LATCFGWTWEYIDEYVTVPRLLEMAEYWRQVPPLQEAFAGFIGFKPASTPTQEDDSDALMKDLMSAGFQMPAGLFD